MSEIQPMFSPFEAMRRQRSDGAEYWSARELQPVMGYSKWQDFLSAIDRARTSASNMGADIESAFVQVVQLMGAHNLGDQRRYDYQLSRYACYLVAMNGDPRKPEIASAQTYFAVRTREAEQREVFTLPQTFAEALELAAKQAREIEAERERADRAEVQVLELAPAARMADELMAAEGDYSLRAAGQMLSRSPSVSIGQNTLMTYLREIKWVDRHGEPYQAQVKLGRIVRRSTSYDHPHTGEPKLSWQIRVTAKGLAELHRLLSAQGETGLVAA